MRYRSLLPLAPGLSFLGRSFLGRSLLGVFLLAAPFALPARADDAAKPIIIHDSQFAPVIATDGMVVAQDELAARAGREILAKGGNAVDAAVAAGFALAVTHPQAGNIGGGGFMLIHLAKDGRDIAIDYREMAPSGASRDMFLDADGRIIKGKSYFSAQASGVPGTVMGLTEALRKYGRLPLATVMAPAIRLAEKGFEAGWAFSDSLARGAERLRRNPAAARYYLHSDGSPYRPGERFMQKDLAATLRQIAKGGADAFYRGPIAQKIVAEQQEGGGLISLSDLAAYKAVERPVVAGTFHGYRIVTMPPPSSGGVHLIEMLNILEGFDLKAMGLNSAAYIHHLAEAMRPAYADRSKWLGDPDFVSVPVAALTSKAYAAKLRAEIPENRARKASEIAPAKTLSYESNETTHFVAADKDGNVVSNTYTLNFSFGNGRAVPGAGFLMNNEMDDFSSKPGVPNAFGVIGDAANAIEPGKRPLSSMTPAIVFTPDGKPYLATGSPGGSTIITVVLQEILNTLVFGMNTAAATAAPRIHNQWLPDKLYVEPGISPDTIRLLAEMGEPVMNPETGEPNWQILGSNETVMLKDGLFFGTVDTRRPGGAAIGYSKSRDAD